MKSINISPNPSLFLKGTNMTKKLDPNKTGHIIFLNQLNFLINFDVALHVTKTIKVHILMHNLMGD